MRGECRQGKLSSRNAPTRPKAIKTSAHVLRRIAALFYDSILLSGVLFTATALLLAINRGEAFRPGNPFYSVTLVIISGTFFTWFWTHGGQTLGMRSWRIRLELQDGKPCDTRTAITYLIAGAVFTALLGIGWWYALIDCRGRTLQDVICGTRVVRVDP